MEQLTQDDSTVNTALKALQRIQTATFLDQNKDKLDDEDKDEDAADEDQLEPNEINQYTNKFMEISENVINYISLQKAKLIDIIGKITDSELGIFDSDDDEDMEQIRLEDDGAELIDEDENLKAIITNGNLFEAQLAQSIGGRDRIESVQVAESDQYQGFESCVQDPAERASIKG